MEQGRERIQGDLFHKEEDHLRDFLKGIFHSCSHIYSFKILEEIFQEFTFELEAEKLMEEEERRRIVEEDIEDDF